MQQEIFRHLSDSYPWKEQFHFLEEVGSTNDRLKQLARQGAPQGTVLMADRQIGGHGRLGRSFHSPGGAGVYLSMLLQPECAPLELMHLTCAVAVAMWWWEGLARVLSPYLVVLNALPKTALGPIFIVWMGAGMGAIIVMTLAISLIVTILNMYQGFLGTDPEKLRLMRSLGASRWQILWLLVFPASCPTLFATLKVNVGLSWVGVIMGEFLVSRAGLGYLIVYGSQVFNMDLVMCSVLLLAVAAVLMYRLVLLCEKKLQHDWGIQT